MLDGDKFRGREWRGAMSENRGAMRSCVRFDLMCSKPAGHQGSKGPILIAMLHRWEDVVSQVLNDVIAAYSSAGISQTVVASYFFRSCERSERSKVALSKIPEHWCSFQQSFQLALRRI